MPTASRWLALSWLPLALGCGIQGSVEETGRSLVAPAPEQLLAGRRVVSGHYAKLKASSDSDELLWASALRTDGNSAAWVSVALEGDAVCSVEGIVDHASGYNSDVALLLDDNRTLHFVDRECGPWVDPLDNVDSVPSWRVPIETSDGSWYWFSDPGEGMPELVDLGGEVSDWDFQWLPDLGFMLWTLSSGHLVARDHSGEVVREYDGEIGEFATLFDGSLALLRDDVLFEQLGWDGEEKRVAEDSCHLSSAGQAFVHHTPCAERQLVLSRMQLFESSVEGAATLFSTSHAYGRDNIFPQDSRVTFWLSENDDFLRPAVFYLTADDEQASTGTLWYDAANAEPVRIGSRGYLEPYPYRQPFVDWDGERGTAVVRTSARTDLGAGGASSLQDEGDLALVGPDATTLPYEGFFLLGEEGETGSLARAGCDDPLGERVPAGAIVYDYSRPDGTSDSRYAFVANVDGDRGDLFLLHGCDVEGPVASRVVAGSVQSMQFPPALVYLAEPTRDSGATLRAWLTEAELEVTISDGVGEFVALPIYGVAYTVISGERAGIWFSGAT